MSSDTAHQRVSTLSLQMTRKEKVQGWPTFRRTAGGRDSHSSSLIGSCIVDLAVLGVGLERLENSVDRPTVDRSLVDRQFGQMKSKSVWCRTTRPGEGRLYRTRYIQRIYQARWTLHINILQALHRLRRGIYFKTYHFWPQLELLRPSRSGNDPGRPRYNCIVYDPWTVRSFDSGLQLKPSEISGVQAVWLSIDTCMRYMFYELSTIPG